MVFVEYEEEVDAERGRVKGLLEKLRIDAEVVVFWLASGELATYETIVSGQAVDPATETMVNECLKDEEWWDELQSLRNRPKSMSASQELDSLANIVELTAGRPGIFNPHNELESYGERRRHSMARLAELHKKPTVSTLARLGVSMGIHTANLQPNVFNSSSESGSDSDSEFSEDGRNVDFNDDASAASEGDLEFFEPVRRPLLSTGRRKSHNDAQLREPFAQHKTDHVERISRSPGAPPIRSYGTISPMLSGMGEATETGSGISPGTCYQSPSAVNAALLATSRPATPRRGLSRNTSKEHMNADLDAQKSIRPAFSQQSSHLRLSSHLTSPTEVTDLEEGAGHELESAEPDVPRGRPGLSRTNSHVRFSSRLLPETRVTIEGDSGPSVSFAPEPETRTHTMPPSPGEGPIDVAINIPDLLAAYKWNPQGDTSDENGGSNNETSGLPLSFNDLPARAQYLILNELLRQNSGDSAVLFTTLPIPSEGTCRSEEASVQYLSDIEVLCNDLPPILLVLSNNMTYALIHFTLIFIFHPFSAVTNDFCRVTVSL